jgi:hypothetical protein
MFSSFHSLPLKKFKSLKVNLKKGSRGKRSVNTLDPSLMMEEPVSSDNADVNEGGEWPEHTQSFYDFQRNVRAPKGFFGMRGKKDFANAEKRALMGYQQVCVCLFAYISELTFMFTLSI